MKKVCIAIVLGVILLTSSCVPDPGKIVRGIVESKSHSPEWLEIVPPGIRSDCGMTSNGKFECGFHFFINSKSIRRPDIYTIVLRISDSCFVRADISLWEFNYVEVGDQSSRWVEIENLPECAR